MFKSKASELRVMLPPGLAAMLERLAVKARRKRYARGAEAYHEKAKRIVSRAVGWDSSQPSCRTYTIAMAFYAEIAGF